jgi:DNA-binding response OmpR family regulator
MAAITILLVDDDEALCQIMRTLLEHEGFENNGCWQCHGSFKAHQLRTIRCAPE